MTESVISEQPQQPIQKRIKKLPPLLVNQLAAGEVVTRPASVVKELIENAIDAGAKNIDVRISQGGMGMIEVADDGCGIHADDMIMAVTRFATSKIADVAHLQGIATLGFRGEALAATAAVSRLTLKSCADKSGIGRELNVAGILDDTPQLIPVVHPQGTTVTVKDLYFNVPARRGNLKSISTEYAHIEMVVKQLALVASDVSFSLWHNDKRRFNFPAIMATDSLQHSAFDLADSQNSVMNKGLMQAILARLKLILPTTSQHLLNDENLQPIDINLDGLQSEQTWEATQQSMGINGLLIPSHEVMINPAYKLIYINGRLVKDRRIAQSMRDSMSAVSHVQSLGYVLFFNLPKHWLNLNVHPSKQCIKVQNLANIMAHLEVGIKDALILWQKKWLKQQSFADDIGATHQHHSLTTDRKSVNINLDATPMADHLTVNSSAEVYNTEDSYQARFPVAIHEFKQSYDARQQGEENVEPANIKQVDIIGSVVFSQCLYLVSYEQLSKQVVNRKGQRRQKYFTEIINADIFHKVAKLADYKVVQQWLNQHEVDEQRQLATALAQPINMRLAVIQVADSVFLISEIALLQLLADMVEDANGELDLTEYFRYEDNDQRLAYINQQLLRQVALERQVLQQQSLVEDTVEHDIPEQQLLKKTIQHTSLSTVMTLFNEYAITKLSFQQLIAIMLQGSTLDKHKC